MRSKSRVTSLVTVVVLAVSLFGLTSVIASGVTVITHGFQFSGLGYPGWVDEMAKAVTNAAYAKGLKSSWYHLRVTGNVFSGVNAVISQRSVASATDTSEVVFTVNWADVADHNAVSSPGITTADIAGWVAGGLRMVDSSIGLGQPLASRHIHLIGHSRGGSVVLETARILGSFGIWVDHITTLDPHPLSLGDTGVYSPPGWHPGDPAARLFENVIFADNYWRKDDIPSPGDFNGQEILGAEDIHLSESVLSGPGYTSEHSDVHAWYHGTIGSGSSFPPSDGEVTIPDEWYVSPHPARHLSGFFFSRIANGSLLYRPAFSYAIGTKFGGRHVRETTSRAGGSQWANIGFIQTPAFPNNKYPQGQPITASFKYQDRDSGVRVEWFIDADKNPLNNTGNPMVVQTFDSTGDKVSSSSATIPTVGLSVSPPRYLLAKITSLNNNAVRYEYADNSFTITWPDFVLQGITPASVVAGAGVTRLTLNGSAFGVGDKVLFFNGTTTTPITPVSRTASQIVVDFDFGATLRT